jgi:hypothetical protein
MSRTLILLVAGTALVFPRAAGGVSLPRERVPVGKWRVQFTNGVVEVCVIRKDRTVSVVEPRRTSGGHISSQGSSWVIRCRDDRIERWTPDAKRFSVEHWFPASQFPRGRPVLGIATRVP